MRHINHDYALDFNDPSQRWFSEQVILFNLYVLTVRDIFFLRENPDFPKLYDSDMIYKLPEQLERRPTPAMVDELNQFLTTRMGMTPAEVQHHLDLARGVEIFRDAPRMQEHGGGDCDNMACLRAAEIIVAAESLGTQSGVRPYLVWHEDGERMIYHAKVKHVRDNSDEDPSIIMGMGGQDRAYDRREECRKNYERYDNLWQAAKRIMASDGLAGDVAYAKAEELKAACDSFGYLPKDGVFRVGRPEQRAVLGWYDKRHARPARALDLLGAVKAPTAEHYIERCSCGKTISQCRCPSKYKTQRVTRNGCAECKAKIEQLNGGHGGGHGGGHHGGHHSGMHQNWGFGGPAPWTIYPQYDLQFADPIYELDIEYDYDIVSAAPEPHAQRGR